MTDRNHLLEAAIAAVQSASRVCLHVQETRPAGEQITKEDRSPVTIADFGVQAVVSQALTSIDSTIPIIGEETTDALRTDDAAETRGRLVEAIAASGAPLDEHEALAAIDRCSGTGGATGRHWVLDPIDGTKGFLRRGQYAIALALLEDGVPVLGVLGCPALPTQDGASGALFSTAHGEGAFERSLADGSAPFSIAVTEVDDPRHASFCESVEAAHSAHSVTARIAEILGVEAEPVRIDSQCKYATVARGGASIYLRLPTSAEYRERIWDHAAGALMVARAGGRVSDIHGRDLDFSLGRRLEENRGIVATNGILHDRVLAAVSEALAEGASP